MRAQSTIKSVLAAGAALLIASCGGGGSDATSFNLSVTDAPVDSAARVVVEFTGVEIRGPGGTQLDFDLETPVQIDLLTLQGNASQSILQDAPLPPGDYNFIRLKVNATQNTMDSFIELDDGSLESIVVPSGSQTGLQLNTGFTMPVGGFVDFTVDFDLRKSINDPQGQSDYFLRPSLRLVDNTVVGTITGTVDPSLPLDPSCSNGPDSDMGNAVYVFLGADAEPADVSGDAADPLTTALVDLDESTGEYTYTIGYLVEGDYTLAFTCQGADDDPEQSDAIAFVQPTNTSVVAWDTTVVDFGP